MAIGVICNLDAAMTKLIAYITYIVTTNQPNGRIGMPQVMDADIPQSCKL
jgi:hypothetical protein